MIVKHSFPRIDLYTFGDAAFRPVLIQSMIDNLSELKQSLSASRERLDLEIFRKACHKVQTTLSILDIQKLSNLAQDLQDGIGREDKFSTFDSLCTDIMNGLLEEKNRKV